MCCFLMNPEPTVFTTPKAVCVMALIPPLNTREFREPGFRHFAARCLLIILTLFHVCAHGYSLTCVRISSMQDDGCHRCLQCKAFREPGLLWSSPKLLLKFCGELFILPCNMTNNVLRRFVGRRIRAKLRVKTSPSRL